MYVCIPCRDTMSYTPPGDCRKCGRPLVSSPRKWSPPRKSNLRAWKRIAKGEWLWDRRRVRRSHTARARMTETVVKVKRRKVQVYLPPEDCDESVCRHFGCGMLGHPGMYKMEEIPGTRRVVPNMRQRTNVDMGG